VGFTAVAGLERSQYRRDGFSYDPDPPAGIYAVPPGSYDPRKRIEAMEQDAIDAQVIYPSVALTGPHQYSTDRELQLACVRAYNDWICAFNSADPKRLVGLGIAPLTGIDDLLAEF